jgi:acyl carrier protein
MSSGYDWRRFGTVRDAVVTIIGDHYGLYGRILPLDTDLMADLDSDEIDRLEVLMTMEEVFDVRFSRAAQAGVRTVGDVLSLVESTLADP